MATAYRDRHGARGPQKSCLQAIGEKRRFGVVHRRHKGRSEPFRHRLGQAALADETKAGQYPIKTGTGFGLDPPRPIEHP